MNIMYDNRKSAWLHKAAIIFSILLNVFIIISAWYYSPGILWLLIISIPLVFISTIGTKLFTGFRYGYFSSLEKIPGKLVSAATLQPGHSINEFEKTDLKTVVGNEQCTQPYTHPIFKIELEKENISANPLQLIKGNVTGNTKKVSSQETNTYQFTEGEIVWQVGPDYEGCCSTKGQFSATTFKRIATSAEVKMIEVLLLSNSKCSNNKDATYVRAEKIPNENNSTVFSGKFSTFINAEGLIHFMESLRKLADGKPIGVRLCIENKKDLFKLCYAIQKTQFVPDFIVVEGCAEMPVYESLEFVSRTLQNYSLKDKIKIIASGKIISAFEILKMLAFGADLIYCRITPGAMTQHFPELSLLDNNQKPKAINGLYSQKIIKLMQIGGFRKVSDITLPNFFRRLENFASLDNPLPNTGTLKRIHSTKSNTHPIQIERTKENIA